MFNMTAKNKKRIDEAIETGGPQLIATALDFITAGGLPIWSSALTAGLGTRSVRDKHFQKKLDAAMSQLMVDFKDIDRVHVLGSIQELKDELGEEEFNETLFQKIENAESQTKARMIARALTCACINESTKSRFFEIVHIISTLPVSDLKFLPNAVKSTVHKQGMSLKFNLHSNGPIRTLNPGEHTSRTHYINYFKYSRLKRFEGLGLMKDISVSGVDDKIFLDEVFGGLIVEIIEPLL